MKGFHLTLHGSVKSEWIDRNRHMNMARYLGLFDLACDKLLEESRLICTGTDLTFVAGRVQMAHRRELLEGEEWEIWSGYAAIDAKSVTFVHRLTSDARVRATCDIYSTPFSMQNRASALLSPELIERARNLAVPGLRNPFSLPGARS